MGIVIELYRMSWPILTRQKHQTKTKLYLDFLPNSVGHDFNTFQRNDISQVNTRTRF